MCIRDRHKCYKGFFIRIHIILPHIFLYFIDIIQWVTEPISILLVVTEEYNPSIYRNHLQRFSDMGTPFSPKDELFLQHLIHHFLPNSLKDSLPKNFIVHISTTNPLPLLAEPLIIFKFFISLPTNLCLLRLSPLLLGLNIIQLHSSSRGSYTLLRDPLFLNTHNTENYILTTLKYLKTNHYHCLYNHLLIYSYSLNYQTMLKI